MIDRDQPPSREDEIRRAVFGQVDLRTAELEIVSSIYDGFAAAILVKGQPRTIALTREYGDAVQLMALIERGRSAQSAASGEGPPPVRGEIRVIDGNRCRFIERELEGDKWEVIGPAAASDPETNEMAALRAQPQAREDAPAEAGEVDDDLIERLLDAQQDINLAANETMRQSLADASALIDEIEPILRAALRAQPPAREDAQPVADEVLPVAWVIRTKDGHIRMWTMNETRAKTAAEAWGMEARQEGLSPITHPAPDALRVAVSDIAAERQRQVDAEGWSAERDDEYTDRSLAHAAAAYALGFDLETRAEFITEDVSGGRGETPVWKNRQIQVPASWPSSWDARWWNPSDARRDLVKAGALIVAEIERLDRQALAALQAEQKGGA